MKKRRGLSIRMRLYASFLLVVFSMTSVSVFVYHFTRQDTTRYSTILETLQSANRIPRLVASVADGITAYRSAPDADRREAVYRSLAEARQVATHLYALSREDDSLRFLSEGIVNILLNLKENVDVIVDRTEKDIVDEDLFDRLQQVAIFKGITQDNVDKFISQQLRTAVLISGTIEHRTWVLGIALIFFVILSVCLLVHQFVFITRSIVHPIRKLEMAAGRFGDQDFTQRLEIDTNDEFGLLASTFNAMATQLETSFTSCQRVVHERTTELEAKALELEEANARLVELDAIKSEFLSLVSHELRTPLTSVRGFVKIIDRDFSKFFTPLCGDEGELEEKGVRIRANLAIIASEGERLTRMINDFLDLSKIESGRLDWDDRDIDIADVVHNAVNSVRSLFLDKPDVELIVDLAAGIPVFHADPDRIEQVVINLLNNAVKFTDAGSVTLSATMPSPELIRLKVADTGQGIRSEDLDRIFDKFHQISGDTMVDKPKGTGLGLAICREIVSRYGGRIWAESEYLSGATFYVELPLAPGGLGDRASG